MKEIAVRVCAIALVLSSLAALGCEPGPAQGSLPAAAVDAGDTGDQATPAIVVQPVAEAGAAKANSPDDAGGTAATADEASANADAGLAADDASSPEGGSPAASDAAPVALCDAAFMECAGACVDPQNDPKNCGACGRECAPGACGGGVCQPWVVTTNVDPAAIACDGQELVWSGVGLTQILEVPADAEGIPPSAATVLSGSSSDALGDIAVAGSRVVWTTTDASGQSTLWEASEDATVIGAMVQSGLFAAAGLAVDPSGSFAYVTSSAGGFVTLWRCDLSGASSCSSLASFSSTGIGALAVDDASVFWTDPGNANVSRYRFADASVTVVAYNQPGLGALALDAASVYWVSNGAGAFTVDRTSKDSPASPDIIATGLGTSRTLVSDGRNVYVGTAAALVEAAPIGGGGALQPIAPTGAGPVDRLSYAAGALYWADPNGVTIYGLRVDSALLKVR